MSERENELSEFMTEMKELMDNGTLKASLDFELWLDDVRGECKYCYHDLQAVVKQCLAYLR